MNTKKAMQSEEARGYLEQKIQEVDAQVSELRKKIAKCQEDHRDLLAKRNGEAVSEEPAPKKRRRKAKASEPETVEVSKPEAKAAPAEAPEAAPEVA